MYSIDSYVMYSSNGACKILDIRTESFTGEPKEYYVLLPVGGNASSSIFVPTDNEKLLSRMRPLLSPDEVMAYIRRIPQETPEWIPENRIRWQYFQNTLLEGDTLELIRTINVLRRRKEQLATRGKKNLMADETTLKRAEKILYGEFTLVLNIPEDSLLELIAKQTEEENAPSHT